MYVSIRLFISLKSYTQNQAPSSFSQINSTKIPLPLLSLSSLFFQFLHLLSLPLLPLPLQTANIYKKNSIRRMEPTTTTTAAAPSSSQVEENFSNFYNKWISQLEQLLHLLRLVSLNPSLSTCSSIINQLTSHHKLFYSTKWAAAHLDVLPFFSPLWLTPLESAFLWITGWKPSTLFRLLHSLRQARLSSASTITPDQWSTIASLRVRIKMEEERVEREMERLQVAMADRKMVDLARGEGGEVETAVKEMLVGLEKVMKMADCVRLKTLKGVLDVLTPVQSVDFLAATSVLILHVRKWEKKKKNR